MVEAILTVFQDDIAAKFQRYSLKGFLNNTGWDYLWKSCSDLPIDQGTLRGIFGVLSEPIESLRRWVIGHCRRMNDNSVCDEPHWNGEPLLNTSTVMSFGNFTEAVITTAQAAYPTDGQCEPVSRLGPIHPLTALAERHHALAKLLLFHMFPRRLEDAAFSSLLPQEPRVGAAAEPSNQQEYDWDEYATPDGFIYYHNVSCIVPQQDMRLPVCGAGMG